MIHFTAGPDGVAMGLYIKQDAFSKDKGATPKWGVHRRATCTSNTFGNRFFGVEIICGEVSFFMTVSFDQLQGGGANTAIEVQRIALEKVALELAKRKMVMPKKFYFHFDNCGENKVIVLCLWPVANHV